MRWATTMRYVGGMALTIGRCRSGCSPTGCSRSWRVPSPRAMVHLGDRLGLYRALADADAPLTTTELAARARAARALGARVGLQPGRGRGRPDRRRRAAVASPGGGRRAGRRRTHPAFGDGQVPPPAPDHGRRSSACPRASAPGSGSTTTPTARSAPRASPAASSRGCAPTSCPTVLPQLDGVEAKLRDGAPVARRRLRRRGRRPRARRRPSRASRVTGYDISQHALDLAPRAPGRGGRHQRRVRSTRGRTRCRPTGRPTSS